jgi:hypothetical protein
MRPKSPPFMENVDRTESAPGCWLWTAAKSRNGYGLYSIGGGRVYAHRYSYQLSGHTIPAGMMVDHKCHTKACVRPDHLQVVTASENMQNRQGPQANSKSGVRGVYASGDKWRVLIRAGGRNHSGGVFFDLDEAAAAASRLRASLMTNSLADR